MCICLRIDLLAVPRNKLIDIITGSRYLRTCILVNENSQHEILVISIIADLVHSRRKLSAVVEVYINGLSLAYGACEDVFKHSVAEADRQSHCSRYEAAEQSLEQ